MFLFLLGKCAGANGWVLQEMYVRLHSELADCWPRRSVLTATRDVPGAPHARDAQGDVSRPRNTVVSPLTNFDLCFVMTEDAKCLFM